MAIQDTAHLGASTTGRAVEGWFPHSGPADLMQVPELPMLRDRARDLDRNNSMATNIRRTRTDHIVGTGLQLSPQPNWRVLGIDSAYAADWARSTRAHFDTWAKTCAVDVEMRYNLDHFTRLVEDTRFTSGSALVPMRWVEGRSCTPYRTALQLVEPDRLTDPPNIGALNRIIEGIEHDSNGAVEAYYIANGDVVSEIFSGRTIISNSAIGFMPQIERVPARDATGRAMCLHVYEATRPGQSRGVAAVTPAMALFGLSGKYQLTELQAAVANSKIVGVLETTLTDEQAAEMLGVDMKEVGEIRREWRGELTPASILQIPPGTKLTSHSPQRPATAFASFMEHIGREIGIAFGLPYEMVMRNFSKTNYSSARAALLEAWVFFYAERSRLVFQFLQPVYDAWLEDAVLLGIVDAPNFYENRSAWSNAQWLGQGMSPIDRLKDENANKVALETGNLTERRMYEQQGLDYEQEIEQRYKEARLHKEMEEHYGVTLPARVVDVPDSDEDMDEPPDKAGTDNSTNEASPDAGFFMPEEN